MAARPPPTLPTYTAVKYFISPLNTTLCSELVGRLRNEQSHPEEPHRMVGTVVEGQSAHRVPSENIVQPPTGIRKIVDLSNPKFHQDLLLNSDVIIYDLNSCNLKEAEFALTTLKINNFEGQKIFIAISNVMTWAKTKPKEKVEGEEEADDKPPEEPDSEEEAQPADPPEGEKKTYVRFTEKDYPLRKAAPEYEAVKSLETMCLAASKAKPNLKTYVVCAGVLYGKGQRVFASHFMKARLQEPKQLPVYGKGRNRIPLVHIADLVTYVEKIIEKRPDLPYLLALDHNPKPTQKKIVQSISKGIGTGLVKSMPVDPATPFIEQLSLDLRMRPTMFFVTLEEEEAAAEESAEQSEDAPPRPPRFRFPWKCREGIQKSIEELRLQFNAARHLTQQKILISGPPASGRTYYAKQLSLKYNLPLIDVRGVIEAVKAQPNEFGEEIKNYLNEKREEAIQAKQTEYDQLKERQKKLPKEYRENIPPFNPDEVTAKLSPELLYKCLKWRITQNDCINRGFVLDAFPKSYGDAKQIFMRLPPVAEGEEPDENAKKVIDPRLLPDVAIVLEEADQRILARLQSLPENQIKNPHFSEHNAKRRLREYRLLNDSTTGEYTLEDFLRQYKVATHRVEISSESSRIIESFVRPLDDKEEERRREMATRIAQIEQRRQQARRDMDQKEEITRSIQHEDYRLKKENQQNEQRQILDKKSLALRKYLDTNLVPILSEGITAILKGFPGDPVDWLAEFLFKNSLKVPHPDPSTFEF